MSGTTEASPHLPTATPSHNAWHGDPSLQWWTTQLLRHTASSSGPGDWWHEALDQIGAAAGSRELNDAADRANRVVPELATWDPFGRRIDDITFDDTWRTCLNTVLASGVCGMPWARPDGGYIARGAAMHMWGGLDIGVMCPVTMTAAAIPVLAMSTDEQASKLLSSITNIDGEIDYSQPLIGQPAPHGIVGMAMTEPQGGSDLSASSVTASENEDGTFAISGHKWFVSCAHAEALLVLARDQSLPGEERDNGSRGLSCFLVPGWRDDGSRNRVELQRLKDKLGTRSMPSAEVIFNGATGIRIGEAGRGVPTIIQMVVHTRMDCALGNAGVITRALAETIAYLRQRHAFGAAIVDQPLMKMVLADLSLEREGALALSMYVTACFQTNDDLTRIITPLAKYWVTRRAVTAAIECLESCGGNGYTEELPLARLYRDAQVNSTWEGSGNVMALDLMRALERQPELAEQLHKRILELAHCGPQELAEELGAFLATTPPPQSQIQARSWAGKMSLALQAALLCWRAGTSGEAIDADVASIFIESRLYGRSERVFGDAPLGLEPLADELIARADRSANA